MAVKFISVKCPECGAALDVEEGRRQIFCSYCGTKVAVQNDNEYIYRHIDEAGIKQAETDRMIRLKELELEAIRANQSGKFRSMFTKIWLVVSAILLVLAIGIMFFAGDGGVNGFFFLFYVCGPIVGGGAFLVFKVIPDRESDKAILQSGGIRLPKCIFPCSEQNYDAIQSTLRSAGFRNITCVNMHDLTFGIFQKPGKVESISINGEKVMSGGKVYMPEVSITITYHGK